MIPNNEFETFDWLNNARRYSQYPVFNTSMAGQGGRTARNACPGGSVVALNQLLFPLGYCHLHKEQAIPCPLQSGPIFPITCPLPLWRFRKAAPHGTLIVVGTS